LLRYFGTKLLHAIEHWTGEQHWPVGGRYTPTLQIKNCFQES